MYPFGLAIILFSLQWRVQQTENLGRLVLQNSLQVCWESTKATRTLRACKHTFFLHSIACSAVKKWSGDLFVVVFLISLQVQYAPQDALGTYCCSFALAKSLENIFTCWCYSAKILITTLLWQSQTWSWLVLNNKTRQYFAVNTHWSWHEHARHVHIQYNAQLSKHGQTLCNLGPLSKVCWSKSIQMFYASLRHLH